MFSEFLGAFGQNMGDIFVIRRSNSVIFRFSYKCFFNLLYNFYRSTVKFIGEFVLKPIEIPLVFYCMSTVKMTKIEKLNTSFSPIGYPLFLWSLKPVHFIQVTPF